MSLVAEFDRKVAINSVKWLFNDKEILLSDRDYSIITDGATCTLKLFNPSPDTSGAYTINVDGSQCSANLTVKRKLKVLVMCSSQQEFYPQLPMVMLTCFLPILAIITDYIFMPLRI